MGGGRKKNNASTLVSFIFSKQLLSSFMLWVLLYFLPLIPILKFLCKHLTWFQNHGNVSENHISKKANFQWHLYEL